MDQLIQYGVRVHFSIYLLASQLLTKLTYSYFFYHFCVSRSHGNGFYGYLYIVIAFIINKFLQQRTLVKQESTIGVEHIGPSVHIGEDRAVFDASKATGTVTNVQGDFIARFRQSSSGIDDEQRDLERFRTLFSQS